jgi:hypothetical protein
VFKLGQRRSRRQISMLLRAGSGRLAGGAATELAMVYVNVRAQAYPQSFYPNFFGLYFCGIPRKALIDQY